jgi:hypothetical protein
LFFRKRLDEKKAKNHSLGINAAKIKYCTGEKKFFIVDFFDW